MCSILYLLVSNQRSGLLLVLYLLLVPLLYLKRCRSAQKPLANANYNLTVRYYYLLLFYSNLALAL
jgi:hypothetical protein